MSGYRHYIRVNSGGLVVHGYTTAFEQPVFGDLLLSGQEGRHFQIKLINERGQFKYKAVNGQMVERAQTELDSELASELASHPVPPDPDQELAAAITNATTLDELKKALLGNNGNLARVKGKLK